MMLKPTQILDIRIDCDEYNTGTNGAICVDEDITTIDGIDFAGENNKVTTQY